MHDVGEGGFEQAALYDARRGDGFARWDSDEGGRMQLGSGGQLRALKGSRLQSLWLREFERLGELGAGPEGGLEPSERGRTRGAVSSSDTGASAPVEGSLGVGGEEEVGHTRSGSGPGSGWGFAAACGGLAGAGWWRARGG